MSVSVADYRGCKRKRKVSLGKNWLFFSIFLIFFFLRLEKELAHREREKIDIIADYQMTVMKKDKSITLLTKRARELEKRVVMGGENGGKQLVIFFQYFSIELFSFFSLFFFSLNSKKKTKTRKGLKWLLSKRTKKKRIEAWN